MTHKEIKRLSKKLKIAEDNVKDIMVYDHIINNIPDIKMLEQELELDIENYEYIMKLAKTLHVSKDAVIGFLLTEYLESVYKTIPKSLAKDLTKKKRK
jgi:hypothetical protein